MAGRHTRQNPNGNGSGSSGNVVPNEGGNENGNGHGDHTIQLSQAMMMQLLQGLQQNNNQGDPFARRVKEFGTLGGKRFTGENPRDADVWVQSCETVFRRMQLTEVQKQELAAHHLDGAASYWWEALLPSVDVAVMTWEDFKDRFENRFVPNAVKAQWAAEFNMLKQTGNMTVEQYVTKFNELSRYAPYLVDTPEKKNAKFIGGLHHYLSRALLTVDKESFDRVLDLALKYEEQNKMYHESREKGKQKLGEVSGNTRHQGASRDFRGDRSRFRPYDQGQRGRQFQNQQQGGNQFHRQGGNQSQRQGYDHSQKQDGNQYQRQNGNQFHRQGDQRQGYQGQQNQTAQTASGERPLICYTCGKPGHRMRDCRKGRNAPQNRQGQPTQGRVFATLRDQENVQAD